MCAQAFVSLVWRCLSHFGSSHFMLKILVVLALGEFLLLTSFASTPRRIFMVRKGWSTVGSAKWVASDHPRPKPPSAQWSQTKPSDKSNRAAGVWPDSKQALAPQVSGPQFPRGGGVVDEGIDECLPRDPIPPELLHPVRSFKLDTYTSRRGAAGASKMTTEHLRPLLHEGRSLELFSELCSRLAQDKVPQIVVDMVRSGRLTVLTKPERRSQRDCGGDVIRRLVARTMAQQMAEIVERATAPHQYTLSTRAGCECVAHVLQGLT